MKIVTVCGLGVGSSLILKMTVDSAMTNIGKKATIEHWDMGTIKGVSADLIVTTEGFRKSFEGQDNVVFINNIVDVKEVEDKIRTYLSEREAK